MFLFSVFMLRILMKQFIRVILSCLPKTMGEGIEKYTRYLYESAIFSHFLRWVDLDKCIQLLGVNNCLESE